MTKSLINLFPEYFITTSEKKIIKKPNINIIILFKLLYLLNLLVIKSKHDIKQIAGM